MKLLIDGKEYTIQYAGEAAFNEQCLESITTFFGEIALAENKNDVLEMIKGLSKIPQIALNIFYAGLMENHGMGTKGDKAVPDKDTAKKLLMTYIADHKNTKEGNFSAVLNMCVEQMQKDRFLNLIGLDGMLENESAVSEEIK